MLPPDEPKTLHPSATAPLPSSVVAPAVKQAPLRWPKSHHCVTLPRGGTQESPQHGASLLEDEVHSWDPDLFSLLQDASGFSPSAVMSRLGVSLTRVTAN